MRRALGVLAAVTLLVAGCGHQRTTTEVSGSCGLDKDDARLAPVPTALLTKTLGVGRYRLSGDISGRLGTDDPLNGHCSVARVDDDGKVSQRLQIAVNGKGQPFSDYDEQVARIDAGTGVTLLSGVRGYVDTSGGSGCAGLIVDGDQVYGATLLRPRPGVDRAEACEELVRATVAGLARLTPAR